jgi:hypothetical protein
MMMPSATKAADAQELASRIAETYRSTLPARRKRTVKEMKAGVGAGEQLVAREREMEPVDMPPYQMRFNAGF